MKERKKNRQIDGDFQSIRIGPGGGVGGRRQLPGRRRVNSRATQTAAPGAAVRGDTQPVTAETPGWRGDGTGRHRQQRGGDSAGRHTPGDGGNAALEG